MAQLKEKTMNEILAKIEQFCDISPTFESKLNELIRMRELAGLAQLDQVLGK